MGVLDLLSYDDWIYSGILVSSFGISWAIRSRKDVQLLANSGGIIGFLMALLILRLKIFYSIPLALFSALSIKFAPPRYLTTLVFLATFVYLMFCRYLHYFCDISELASQANGLQLLMTLRVIGLAFEVSDSRRLRADPKAFGDRPRRFLQEEPSFFQIFTYFYHFCGLFTGPYYSYQMFLDSQDPVLLNNWSPVKDIKERGLRICWSVPLFVISNRLFPLDALRSDAVWDMSFPYRMFYAAMVFVVFRNRVYSAWAVSESICVTLGLGIYPSESRPRTVVGPTDLDVYEKLRGRADVEYNSEAIVNLDIYEVEFSEGYRKGIRSWNKSVQSWLALFVHSRANKLYRVELTMFVSALWHGTYAGYFMSFLIIPMCTMVEDIIFKMVPEATRPTWFKWLYIMTIRSRGLEFLATGFLLKNFADTHRFWSSLYYWLLLSLGPIYAANKIYTVFFRQKRPRDEKKAVEEKKEL